MKKLTARERHLIFLAMIVLLAGLGYYFTSIPSDAALYQANSENHMVRTEYNSSKRLLEESGKTKEALDFYKRYCKEQRDIFDPVLSSYELERKVSYFLEKNGIHLTEVRIQEAVPVSGGEKSREPIFYKSIIRVKAAGNASGFYDLLSEMETRKDMIITSFNMDDTGLEVLFDIEFTCYMMAEDSRLE